MKNTPKSESLGITFQAILYRATTMTCGGWRITLDIAESDTENVTALSKMRNQVLQVAVLPVPEGEEDWLNE